MALRESGSFDGSRPAKETHSRERREMSILTIFELHGDPDQLFSQHQETIVPLVEPIARGNGGLSSTVVRTDDGLMVVNHWESMEGMEKTSAEVRPKASAAGMPEPTNWRSYEVLDHRVP
jgi:hypothetical protein